MAENDGNGKIEKVPVWITSDGSEFLNEEDAITYQNEQDAENTTAGIFRQGQTILSNEARSLTKVNGYYRMINGQFFGTNDVYDALTSLVVDTPESTLSIITELNKRRLK